VSSNYRLGQATDDSFSKEVKICDLYLWAIFFLPAGIPVDQIVVDRKHEVQDEDDLDDQKDGSQDPGNLQTAAITIRESAKTKCV
jgi:hypothetical protein